jgi:hypothetical protein
MTTSVEDGPDRGALAAPGEARRSRLIGPVRKKSRAAALTRPR